MRQETRSRFLIENLTEIFSRAFAAKETRIKGMCCM